jgi:3-deoxy-D-manno-octulosonic-acid transferase
MGPYYENFRAIVDRLHEQDAIRIAQTDEIEQELATLFVDEGTARAMGKRGYAVFTSEAGATARAVEALTALLGEQG